MAFPKHQSLAARTRELGGEASFTFMQELENAANELDKTSPETALHYLRVGESHLRQIMERLLELTRDVESLR